MKIRVADERSVISAAVTGCKKDGRRHHSATAWKSQRRGNASKPAGECTKCSISIADVMAKKVDGPRQYGNIIATNGSSTTSIRQPEAHSIADIVRRVRTTNQR